MFTPNGLLGYFKFQYSINKNGTRFSHTCIDRLPSLHYRHGYGTNWAANDYRVTTKVNEISEWFNRYWDTRASSTSGSNQDLYEAELEQAILDAYNKLNEKWTKKLEHEFEQAFDNKILGFLNAGQK